MEKYKCKNNNWLNNIRHQFLLTFFDDLNTYQEKEVNGFILIKQFNKHTSSWQVAVYTRRAFEKKIIHKAKVADLLTPRRNK
ncbi:hypothetical protein A2382_03105 [Candidatus Woesebacteria bacterium RIFOXYB1_FULL_38_16]|uniref:Uncharacterized protein n=1 Tax=Candidatus Woesebacteria bacterium RIFOXYB1_FULL_38_16 TaxID=1802538 RepID=A0A1F8CUD3_9BACT|nr:MAG: hypothetical protein A2382_03105 [Candidatus Woesebacteria bacterium RIFOXYB1_FULL_38_16]